MIWSSTMRMLAHPHGGSSISGIQAGFCSFTEDSPDQSFISLVKFIHCSVFFFLCFLSSKYSTTLEIIFLSIGDTTLSLGFVNLEFLMIFSGFSASLAKRKKLAWSSKKAHKTHLYSERLNEHCSGHQDRVWLGDSIQYWKRQCKRGCCSIIVVEDRFLNSRLTHDHICLSIWAGSCFPHACGWSGQLYYLRLYIPKDISGVVLLV